jgi:hypothetical protein
MGSRDRLDGVEIGRQSGAGGFRVVQDCSFIFPTPIQAALVPELIGNTTESAKRIPWS